MRRSIFRICLVVLVVATFSACEKAEVPAPENQSITELKKGGNGGPAPTVTTYSGRAIAIDATIWTNLNGTVTNVGAVLGMSIMMPMAGGTITASEPSGTIPGVLTSGALFASTSGQNNTSISEASATSLSITLGTNIITADYIKTTATTGCGAVPSGTVQITNLKLNGMPITVTGAVSQAVFLPNSNGGMIILNERSGTKKRGFYSITVTGMHIIAPDQQADIKIADALAGTGC